MTTKQSTIILFGIIAIGSLSVGILSSLVGNTAQPSPNANTDQQGVTVRPINEAPLVTIGDSSQTIAKGPELLELAPIPDPAFSAAEANKTVAKTSVLKPCRGCDSDDVSKSAWLQLVRGEDIRILKDLTTARRKPEHPPSVERYRSYLSGLKHDRRQSAEDVLRIAVRHKIQNVLPLVDNPIVRSTFLYQDAFDCGIPPEQLLQTPTGVALKAIKAAAVALSSPESLQSTPTVLNQLEMEILGRLG